MQAALTAASWVHCMEWGWNKWGAAAALEFFCCGKGEGGGQGGGGGGAKGAHRLLIGVRWKC